MKRNGREGGGGGLQEYVVIISGCPIYLTLTIPTCQREEENRFLSPRGRLAHGSWHNNRRDTVRAQRQRRPDFFFILEAASGDQKWWMFQKSAAFYKTSVVKCPLLKWRKRSAICSHFKQIENSLWSPRMYRGASGEKRMNPCFKEDDS